jgi:thioredoxin reductase
LNKDNIELQDCIIIGGGPAGLNAAVVLGRCRRKVMLFDTAEQRNRLSQGMHNYLTRDDILPPGFIQLSQQEIHKYGVKLIHKKIISARKNSAGIFEAKDEEGTVYHSKKLLVATGVRDNLPSIEGIKDFYGRSIFHCPYCDGWEVRDKKIGVYAKTKDGAELALALKGWSENITLYTDGGNKIKPLEKQLLDANNIPVVKERISKLKGENGILENIVLKNGDQLECDALFFVNGFTQQCDLAEAFGCEVNRKGVVVTNISQQTNITGLYVAGDASRDMHFVVVAAAEGAKAGVNINKELQKEISEAKLRSNPG